MWVIALFSFGMNIPLGLWRSFQRKFSLGWFIAVHASVPFIIALRQIKEIDMSYSFVFIILAVAGQTAGGRLLPRMLKSLCHRRDSYELP